MADKKNWLQLLAYVTGSINQELLLRNEYLAAENHILKSQIKGRLRLSDGERATLAGIAKRLGRKALQEIACVAKPDRSWPGIGSSSLRNSTARRNADWPAAPESMRQSKNWW